VFVVTLLLATNVSAPAEANVPTIELVDHFPEGAMRGDPIDVEENYSTLVEKFFNVEPDRWGGAFVNGDTLAVRAVGYSVPYAEAMLSRTGLDKGISVIPGTRSIRDLELLTQRAIDLGIGSLVTAGPLYAREQVAVGLRADDPEAREALAQIDPGAYIAYTRSRALSTSRYYDTSPFYGGNRILLKQVSATAGVACSSAFAWSDPDGGSDNYMVTAAHCYYSNGNTRPQVNRISSNQVWTPIGTLGWSSGNDFGTVPSRRGDVATYKLLAGNSSKNKIYVGTCDTSSTRTVSGQSYLPEGWTGTNLFTSGSACAQGAGTGEVNLDWISAVNQTVVFTNAAPNQTFNKLTIGNNASTCVESGDSGGAVYLIRPNGEALAVGVVSGADWDGWGPLNCHSYYTPIGIVTQDFGGSLKVTQ